MNKKDLIRKVAGEVDLSQNQAKEVVEVVLGSIQDAIAAGEPVNLTGFGTFSLKHRDEHEGRNPSTGEIVTISASNTPVFKPGKMFKEKVN